MNGTGTDQTTAYADAVRAALADLPESSRDDLLDDLDEHLAEVAAEGGDLVALLGPPESYAAELRAAAGFVGGFPDPPPKRADLRVVAARVLRSADVRLGPLFGYERAGQFLVQLRPAWWVLRGYLAAMVVAGVLDDSGQPLGLLPRIGGSELVALALTAAGVLASIWLGRRAVARPLKPWPRYALYAGSVMLVLIAVGGFLGADSDTRDSGYDQVDYQNPYGQVQDVFVYDRQGRLVEGARLYDQEGNQIRLGNPYCWDDELETEVAVAAADGPAAYPYCARNAPFGAPSPSVGPSASPSGAVSVSPTPSGR